jgi:tol-pal system protein YbgF
MPKQWALILLSLCFAIPAQAGLLEDDEARNQIRQLEMRVLQMEGTLKQQTKSLLDLQSQIDALNTQIRNLRGLNEEISHGLQDAEKRQKDFYVDLDTRVRHFESAEEAAKAAATEAATAPAVPAAVVPVDPFDTAPENRAFESAYGIFRGGDHANAAKAFQEFIKKYPESDHVPNANFWLGKSQIELKSYKSSLLTYQDLIKAYPGYPKAPDVMLDIAKCQRELKQVLAAKKTLKQLVANYPNSEAAAKAKKQLASAK